MEHHREPSREIDRLGLSAWGCMVSGFSNVDASVGVERLVSYLQATDAGLVAIKQYIAFTAKRMIGTGLVLDVGCGLGTDLGRLEAVGLDAVGVDPSMEMLTRARDVSPRTLARSDGGSLPFRSGSFDGCRVERVLQHVADPTRVVGEIARIVRPGGAAFVFEPDYSTFHVESDTVLDGSLPAALLRVRHPRIGAHVASMLERARFRIDDVVTESSRGYHVERLPIDVEAVLTRAVRDGRCESATAVRWMAEQRERSTDGSFRARWDKVLVVATREAG